MLGVMLDYDLLNAKDAVKKILKPKLLVSDVNREMIFFRVYLFYKALPNGRIWCGNDERIREQREEQ